MMTKSQHQPTYAHHRYPKSIIAYAVWVYHRFCLSYRDVEDLLAERGVIISYEAIRQWCLKFGHAYARRIRRNRGQIGDKWHLDEVFATIRNQRYYLYRAIDQFGNILDILLLQRRTRTAVLHFFKKLRATYQRVPRVIITDKLRSYQAALREIFKGVDHRQHKGLNNRIEASHRRTRKRQRFMQQFPSAASAQRFLSAFEFIQDYTRPKRPLTDAAAYRTQRAECYDQWRNLTTLAA